VVLPGLLLLFAAGAAASGGEGFVEALRALAGTTSLALGAGGAIALAGGLLILRRELRSSGRAARVIVMLGGAALCALVSLATLERVPMEGPWASLLETGRTLGTSALVEPVNLMALALALAVVLCVVCFELDEDSPRPIVAQMGLCMAMVLWYGFAAAGRLQEPIRAVRTSLETGLPLATGSVVATFLGIACVSARTAELRTRKIGAVLLALAGAAILVLGAASVAGALPEVKQWPGAVLERLRPLPSRFPRSGSLGIIAVGLMIGAVYVLRAGLARVQAFYAPRR
jgi:hypothetical protein